MKRLFVAGVSPVGAGEYGCCGRSPRPAALLQGADLPATALTWSGFYLGVNGGGAFGTSTWDTAGSINITGGLVGGTIGYNYQINHFVIGAEGDIDWASISGSTTTVACPAGCKTGNSWLVDRARPRRLRGRSIPALRHRRRRVRQHPGHHCRLDDGRSTNAGWTVGAGLEFAITPNWSAKAEYLYVNLGKFNCGLNCGAVTDNVSFSTNLVPRRRQLPLLRSATTTRTSNKTPGLSPGVFHVSHRLKPSSPSRRTPAPARRNHRAMQQAADDRRASCRRSEGRDSRARRQARSGQHGAAQGVALSAGGAASSSANARSTLPAWWSSHFASCFSCARQRPS